MSQQEGGIPLYKRTYDQLRKRILEGEYAESSYLPSENELCTQFEIGRSTLRKAMSMVVDDGLIEKKQGGRSFVKSLITSTQTSQQSNNILLVFPRHQDYLSQVNTSYYANIIFNTDNECRKHGYNLIYARESEDNNIFQLANGNTFSGAIFVGFVSRHLLQECLFSKTPSVLINYGSDGFITVVTDNENGILKSLQCLSNAGHKKIAAVIGAEHYYNSECRLEAFRKYSNELKIPIVDEYMIRGDWSYESGFAAAKKLMELKNPPTAILAFNDAMAIGVIHRLQELGLSVPNDVSVTGFDNVESSAYTTPKLTTVDVNVTSIVSMSCMLLFKAISDERGVLDYRVTVPVRFVERNSVAPPPSKKAKTESLL